jgi:single-strand DNA-binding protein
MVSGRLQVRSWETDNGEKRSKVEILADEIGPSLRWATAQVTRTERREGGGGGGGFDAPPPTEAPTYSQDEEPF